MDDKKRQHKKKWPDRAIDKLNSLENKFLGKLFVPFIVCFKHGMDFFLWVMFVIVAGQLGTIINVVNRVLFQDWTVAQAIYPDSVFGSFYTYALVLIASLIAPVFTRIKNDVQPGFRSMTIGFVTLLIFVLIFCAVFFSFASQETSNVRFDDIKDLSLTIDVKQLIFFVLAVMFAWYALGLSLMVQNNECKEIDDEYLKEENEGMDKKLEESRKLTNDGKGTKI